MSLSSVFWARVGLLCLPSDLTDFLHTSSNLNTYASTHPVSWKRGWIVFTSFVMYMYYQVHNNIYQSKYNQEPPWLGACKPLSASCRQGSCIDMCYSITIWTRRAISTRGGDGFLSDRAVTSFKFYFVVWCALSQNRWWTETPYRKLHPISTSILVRTYGQR